MNKKTTNNAITEIAQINHYYFGTQSWFEQVKIPRREKWRGTYSQEDIDFLNEYTNQIYDDTILRFVPALKKKMIR